MTHAYINPLNKSMRYMEDSGNIDSMMKLCDAGGIDQNIHRDWKSKQSKEKTLSNELNFLRSC
jgi:hypothetical protein